MLLRFWILTFVLLSQVAAMQFVEVTTQGLMRRFGSALPKPYTFKPIRWCSTSSSSFVTPFMGRFVSVESNGLVHIHQPLYPKFQELKKTGDQLFAVVNGIWFDETDGKYYRSVGKIKIRDGMPWRDLEEVDIQKGLLFPNVVEARVTEAPYEIINVDQMDRSPYFSCGRIDMRFPNKAGLLGGTCHGSAAAIDQNLLVTAAHNFLPSSLEGRENKLKTKADSVHFLHLHTAGNHPRRIYAASVASTHCFVHPEWEKNFNPHYDIALIFLSESLNVTAEEKEKLLKLHILPHTLEDSIQVIGYPLGSDNMQRTTGITKREHEDVMQVIYHKANTESGSSGSPIVMGNRSLVGVHTRAPEYGGEHNRGVRIRHDLMPFLDECIAQHQSFLKDSNQFLIDQENRKRAIIEAQEEKLREQGREQVREQGREQGELSKAQEIAKALINEGDRDEKIARTTGLSLTEVQALRASLPKS